MFQGIIFALAACFVWGLIFVVPQFMTGFTPIEVALGRYVMYGGISVLIFCKSTLQGKFRYSRSIWLKALSFSFVSTIGYYTCVVLALRYASPSVCVLILGISPITIALYGNWKEKETSFRGLAIPSALILLGLIIINAPHLETCASNSSYVLGLFCAVLALIGWSWYVVANTRLLNQETAVSVLKKESSLNPSDWPTLIGVAALFWVLVLGVFLSVFFEDQIHMEKYFTPHPDLTGFLIGSAILGILCSWVGAFLWNRASLALPVSLAGQLTIFETLFALLFVYIIEGHLPPLTEGIGMGILLIAVVYGIRQFAGRKASMENL